MAVELSKQEYIFNLVPNANGDIEITPAIKNMIDVEIPGEGNTIEDVLGKTSFRKQNGNILISKAQLELIIVAIND
jgi:hypothetical protein